MSRFPWFPPLLLGGVIAWANDTFRPEAGRLLPIVYGMATLCLAVEIFLWLHPRKPSPPSAPEAEGGR